MCHCNKWWYMDELGSVVGVIVVRMLLLILLCLYEIRTGIGRLHTGLWCSVDVVVA